MIRKELGETMIFTGGNEPASPQVTIEAHNKRGERYSPYALRLKEAGSPETGLLVSLETLKAMIAWAEKT